MYLGNALSRANLQDSMLDSTLQSELCHTIEELYLTEHLAISSERLQLI